MAPQCVSPTAYFNDSIDVVTGEYCEMVVDLVDRAEKTVLGRTYRSGSLGWMGGWETTLPEQQDPRESSAFRLRETDGGYSLHTRKGDTLVYDFAMLGENRLLASVSSTFKETVQYTYGFVSGVSRPLLTEKSLYHRPSLINEYYHLGVNRVGEMEIVIDDPMDFRLGRVREQRAFVGIDESPVVVAYLFYQEGETIAFDGNQQKTIYRYDNQKRLSDIEQYDAWQGLYRSEKLIWEKETSRLRFRALMDSQGMALAVKGYLYDELGNIIEEARWGYEDLLPFLFSEEGVGDYIPCERMRFEYRDEDPSLLSKKVFSNGLSVLYDYENGRVSAIFVFEGEELLFRTFYAYNDEGWEVSRVVDDGCAMEEQVLDGVTERRTRITEYCLEGPYFGEPLRKEEWYQGEKGAFLLKESSFVYSPCEKYIEEISHEEEIPVSVCHVYDRQNRLIQERLETGERREYVYDLYGNRIREQSSRKNFPIHHVYDLANRRIYTETMLDEGTLSIERFVYDPMGQMIAKRDTFDNEIRYEYDVFGRHVRTIYPLVPYGKEAMVQPVTEVVYDESNHRIGAWDANGFWMEEPKNDATVSRSFDALQRVVKETWISTEGGALHSAEYHYSGTKPREVMLSDGRCFRYHYDEKGRRASTEIEAGGETLFLPSEKATSHKEHPITSPRFPINEYDHLHPHGFRVVVRESIDEEGNVCITTADAMGRIQEVVQRDVWGQCFSHVEYAYDPKGNKIEEVHHRMVQGESCGSYGIEWLYGIGGRIEEVVEKGDGLPMRRTSYYYDTEGRLEAVIKPNGVVLFYSYNSWGKTATVHSSDGTIDYTYLYDASARLVQIMDGVSGGTHQFTYNTLGLLIDEQQLQGLSLGYQYDSQGRKQEVTLPDGSSIGYVYEGGNLSEIQRKDAMGNHLYSHHYLLFNADGRPLEERLMYDQGIRCSSYDEEGRVVAVDTPFMQESIKRDDYGRVSSICWRDSCQEGEQEEVVYDVLGRVVQASDERYSYDSLSNKYSEEECSIQYDILNAKEVCKERAFRYDKQGNRMVAIDQKGVATYYTYDALDRLCRVDLPEKSVEYRYDAFGRRVAKRVFSTSWDEEEVGFYEEKFLYDGSNEIGSYGEANAPLTLRILGIGLGGEIGAAVAVEIGGDILLPLHDFRGNVRLLIDAKTGLSVASYSYTPFGEEHHSSSSSNPWRFASKRIDPETGLVFFGKRYYDPMTSSWITPDPSGFSNGPNLYAFLSNDPYNHIDLYGTISFGTFFHTAWEAGKEGLIFFGECIDTISSLLNTIFPFRKDSAREIESVYDEFAGKLFLQFTGYYLDPARVGVHGKGEVDSHVRITLINGLFSIHEDCCLLAKWISEAHGNVNVHYVFRPTGGWTADLFWGLRVKLGYLSQQAKQLAILWRELIHEMGGVEGGGKVLHYAHSLGGTDTFRAQKMMTAEEKALIDVVTFGSATLAPNIFGFASLKHYLSVRDGVIFADIIEGIGAFFGLHNEVEFVGSFWGIPFADHLMGNNTYRTVWEELGTEFVNQYGTVI